MVTVCWKVVVTLPYYNDFKKFPFDAGELMVSLTHKDLSKNIVLVPDLTGYEYIKSHFIPGVNKKLEVSGFDIVRSYFTLEKTDVNTNFGVAAYDKISDHIQLKYVIVLQRQLLNALIIYVIPLLIILISLFAIYTLELFGKKGVDPLRAIGGYTGLFFALVILHRNLRSSFAVGAVLYVEYLFFFTYFTLLLLVLHSLYSGRYGKIKFFNYMWSLFWLIQFGLWFITTLYTFY